MTPQAFARLALAFPEAVQASHMNHPDFRIRNKIFATIHPDNKRAMVKLTPEQQSAFLTAHPTLFTPCQGGWGRSGATYITLKSARKRIVLPALLQAWRNLAPKGLRDRLEPV